MFHFDLPFPEATMHDFTRKQKIAILTIFSFSVLIGCTPAYHPPTHPPPIRVDSKIEIDAGAAIPGDVPSPTEKSTTTAELLQPGGFSLLRAARFALANNHTVRISRQQYDVAGGAYQLSGGRFNWNWSHTYEISRDHVPFTETEKANLRAQGRDDDFAK